MASKSGLHFGQLNRYTYFTFCFLLVLNTLQVPAIHGLVLPEQEGSGKDLCMKDCSNEPISQLCASNAKTYDNMCAFENAQCEGESSIIIYTEPCVTLPPPAVNLCKKQQKKYDNLPDDIFDVCNADYLKEKADNGSLELSDLNNDCYRPYCRGDNYLPLQCSPFQHKWCWCSDSNGVRTEGTLEKGLTEDDCMKRNSCMIDNHEYKDGDLFVPDSGCGLCECLNGEVTCFEEYIPSSDGYLTPSQLVMLKSELLQLFFFQYNHNEHVLINIRHIHQHPTLISAPKKKTVLKWKFEYYDRNGNDDLTPGEQWLFKREIGSFIRCTDFFAHVTELMNMNNDNEIVITEWGSFFDVDMQPVEASVSSASSGSKAKRSVPQLTTQELRVNRLENRKKFHYTLA